MKRIGLDWTVDSTMRRVFWLSASNIVFGFQSIMSCALIDCSYRFIYIQYLSSYQSSFRNIPQAISLRGSFISMGGFVGELKNV